MHSKACREARTSLEFAAEQATQGTIGPRDKRVVIVVYVACSTSEEPVAEPAIEEVSEVRWFARSELPWDEFAFPSTAHALRDYYR